MRTDINICQFRKKLLKYKDKCEKELFGENGFGERIISMRIKGHIECCDSILEFLDLEEQNE